nr:FAD-dependent thymidylate synthase [Candidatus Contendobacter odensis]
MERVDCQGDLLVVNAARASLDKQHMTFDGVNDQRLLNYLALHGHISPFFHPQITLRITAPIFIARQLMRSTVGLAVSEVSRRYVSTPPTYWHPVAWRSAVANVKQGSGGALPKAKARLVGAMYRAVLAVCDTAYRLPPQSQDRTVSRAGAGDAAAFAGNDLDLDGFAVRFLAGLSVAIRGTRAAGKPVDRGAD